ncbi:hypothetical protein NQZ68_002328 [Dissostichus eleginoides]|nr:hypothetical protein NQZ68_002328 [Dissostichus eleginoides]
MYLLSLQMQCASWTPRCALAAPPRCSSERSPLPPSLHPLHPHPAQEQHTPVGERTSNRIFHSNRGSLLSQYPVFLTDLSRRCVQIIRFLRAASLRSRSARRRIGPLASPRRSVHSLEAA